MADRSYLYTRFENYDQPDEQDFRDLIDMAAKHSDFKELVIPNVSDVVTDINTVAIVLEIRDTKLIKHGNDVYIFTNIEGSYGLNGIPITSTMLAYVGSIGSQGLLTDLTSDVNLGGIMIGDYFPAGTPFDSLWRAILTTTTVKNLKYEANDTSSILEVGDTLSITKFKWSVTGLPQNMILSDSAGLNTPVSGDNLILSVDYTFVNPTTITWTLSYSVGSTSLSTKWLYPVYIGKNLTGAIPDEIAILAGTKQLQETIGGVTVNLSTSSTEYGWVAIPTSQTGGLYTKWFIDELNQSSIGPNEFITQPASVTVNSTVYSIYIYLYSSEVTILKLS